MSIAKPQTTSMIDILNQGFATVNRRLWVIVIPVLLNIYVWYGAQISFQPFLANLADIMNKFSSSSDQETIKTVTDGWVALGRYDLLFQLDRLQLLPRLTLYDAATVSRTLLPSELPPLLEPSRVVFQVSSASGMMVLFLAINILLIPIAGVFLSTLASAVRGESLVTKQGLKRVGIIIASLFGYAAILLAGLIVIGFPAVLLGALLFAVSQPIGVLILLTLSIVWFWLAIYIGFSPEAIAVAHLDPLQALRASFMLVRRNFWATLLLLIISSVISIGLGLIWNTLIHSPIGLVIAILGSAYIGSGLVAARMIFFRERLQRI